MRIAVGELWHETNTFSPRATRGDDFDLTRGDAVLERYRGTGTEIGGFVELAERAADPVELVPLAAARAVPGGPVDDAFFDGFADELVDGIARNSVDAALLSLHGSMVTTRRDDPEGDLLRRLRDAVGGLPIVSTLDHHANVTVEMVDAADAFVAYRKHPHTGEDMRETGVRAARLAVDTVAGRIRPTMSMASVPLITATRLGTDREPMRALFERRRALEEEVANALAVSLCPVQPYLDLPDVGFTTLAVTDDDRRCARACVTELAKESWARRHAFEEAFPSVDDALDRLLDRRPSLTVLADRGDVTLGGAPGDSPVILRRLLDRTDLQGVSAALPVVDPSAVRALTADDAEHGPFDLGGRLTPAFDPVEVTGTVVGRYDEPLVLRGSYSAGTEIDMGVRLVVRLDDSDVRVIVSEKPGVTTDPSFFTAHGIDPEGVDLLVVKSIGTFRPGFEPIADEITVVDTPGVCSADLSRLPFEAARPVFPFDDVEPTFDPV